MSFLAARVKRATHFGTAAGTHRVLMKKEVYTGPWPFHLEKGWSWRRD